MKDVFEKVFTLINKKFYKSSEFSREKLRFPFNFKINHTVYEQL